MNEITRIHIAGVAYEIDIDARKTLNKYLKDIENSLGTDAEDVLDDIEIRITEILAERGINRDDVIKQKDVAAIKAQLGQPQDFADPDNKTNRTDQSQADEKIADKVRSAFAEKKFFRDPENGIFGGVIAGFAVYTGWDVTILRVIFALLVIFTAFFPFALLYFILWVCAPAPKTASDRLFMKGEPINIETLKSAAEDVAQKGKSAAKKATKAAQNTAQSVRASVPTAARIVMMIFGIIGFCIFIPMLIALIPVTIFAIIKIITTAIVAKPLFVATAIIAAVLVFTIVSIGLAISTALVSARFTRATSAGLIASSIFAILLTITAATTGSIWVHEVGTIGVQDTAHNLIDQFYVNIDDQGDRVQIDLGPIHIDTSR